MPDAILPAVSLVIPNFNGARLLGANLPAVLAAAAHYPGDCEIIVVDDGSTDDSVARLTREFPGVRLVQHAVNRGFAEAVHSGVEVAANECLVLLNSDVRPDADFIAPLIRHLQVPDVFAVAPLIVDGQGRPTDESWRGYEIRRRRLRPLKLGGRLPDRAVPTLFASGGSMAVRKSRFQALGGFHPIYQPFYWEDIDLGLRAWRRGWRSLFEPGCRIVHDHSDSSIKRHVRAARIQRIGRRNKFLFEWIHLSPEALRQVIPGYAVQALTRLLRLDFVYLGGLYAALRRLPEVSALRRELAATSCLDYQAIVDTVREGLARAWTESQPAATPAGPLRETPDRRVSGEYPAGAGDRNPGS